MASTTARAHPSCDSLRGSLRSGDMSPRVATGNGRVELPLDRKRRRGNGRAGARPSRCTFVAVATDSPAPQASGCLSEANPQGRKGPSATLPYIHDGEAPSLRHQCLGTKLPTAIYQLPTINYQLPTSRFSNRHSPSRSEADTIASKKPSASTERVSSPA